MGSITLWTIPATSTLSNQDIKIHALETRLLEITKQFKHIKFASSLAIEDMVLTDLICKNQLPISIFTLNTGRLNQETADLIMTVNQYWNFTLKEYHPNTNDLQHYSNQFDQNAFYDSVELRRQCCHIRKIEPLNRALKDADAWITGQRRAQSTTRDSLDFQEIDTSRNIAKFNPLFDWSENYIWQYAQTQKLPINELYFQGYPSIGCEPCTKPVKKGDDIRSGRWWWEDKNTKECGLHK